MWHLKASTTAASQTASGLKWANKISYMCYYAMQILMICYYAVFMVLSGVITSNHNYKMLTFLAAYRINSYKRQWEAFTFNTGWLQLHWSSPMFFNQFSHQNPTIIKTVKCIHFEYIFTLRLAR